MCQAGICVCTVWGSKQGQEGQGYWLNGLLVGYVSVQYGEVSKERTDRAIGLMVYWWDMRLYSMGK